MKNWEFYLSIGIYIASQKIPILTVVKVRLKSAMNYGEGFIEIILRLSRLIAYNEIMLKLRKRSAFLLTPNCHYSVIKSINF